VVTLRHDGRSGGRHLLHDVDVVVAPLDGRWRVECEERVVESTYLDYAIAEALKATENDAVAVGTQLLDQHLDATVEDGADKAPAAPAARETSA